MRQPADRYRGAVAVGQPAGLSEVTTARTSASWAARSGPRRQARTTVPPTTDRISVSPPIAAHGLAAVPTPISGGSIAGRPRFGLTVTSTPPDGSAASGSGQPWNSPLLGSGVGHGP